MKSTIMLNGVNISNDTIKFSAGEIQIVLPEKLVKSDNFVSADIRCSEGVMLLLQLASIIDTAKSKLYLGYLPYSRYDFTERTNDALSLKVFCNIVNSMKFSQVTLDDCHSNVGIALLDNCVNVPQHELVLSLVPEINDYEAIIAPDYGSVKKAHKLAKMLCIPVIECGKIRDQETGKIISFHVPVEKVRGMINVLIVDDICDGGGTFVPIIEALNKEVPRVDLYVTHGIFSKGVDLLYDAGLYQLYALNDWIQSEKVDSMFC